MNVQTQNEARQDYCSSITEESGCFQNGTGSRHSAVKAKTLALSKEECLEQAVKEMRIGQRIHEELKRQGRSGFLTAFEGFWNNWACHRDNIMVVVCGSANSWITDKLLNNHGGLYGRTTYEVKLSPFTLNECEQFFKSKKIRISQYDIVQSYMMLGGIPYYLGYFDKDKS